MDEGSLFYCRKVAGMRIKLFIIKRQEVGIFDVLRVIAVLCGHCMTGFIQW